MKETYLKSNSQSYVPLGEQGLRTMLDESTEVLLTVYNQFGEDSKQHQIAEHYFECIKAGYAFCTAKREFNDLCKEHHMTFAAIKEQFDKLGLNR